MDTGKHQLSLISVQNLVLLRGLWAHKGPDHHLHDQEPQSLVKTVRSGAETRLASWNELQMEAHWGKDLLDCIKFLII